MMIIIQAASFSEVKLLVLNVFLKYGTVKHFDTKTEYRIYSNTITPSNSITPPIVSPPTGVVEKIVSL